MADETKVTEDLEVKTPASDEGKKEKPKKPAGADKSEPVKMVQVPEDMLLKMQDEIKKLNAVADAGRLQKYEQIHEKKEIVPVVRINFWNGKAILKWKMEQNISEVDVSTDRSILREKQTIRFWLNGGESVVVDYLEWHRKKYEFQKPAEITGKKTVRLSDDEFKSTDPFRRMTVIYTVQFSDGEELDVDERYVN